jgi:B12-binding domain/radical SAM domain protein
MPDLSVKKEAVNLIIFENAVNRFSIAYLLFILEKNNTAGRFNLYYFKNASDIAGIFDNSDIVSRPCVFMFSFMSSLLCEVMEAVREIKKQAGAKGARDKTLLIAGGAHASGDAGSGIKMGFELIFKGEAENSWPDFIASVLECSSAGNFKDTILSKYNSFIVSDDRPVRLDDFLPFGDIYSLVPPLEIMRGCFFNCKFCQTASCAVKYRSLSSIEEFCAEYRRRGYKRLCFICPSAFHYGAETPSRPNIAAIETILETAREKYGIKFIEYGIFPSESRPETITDETASLIKKYCSNKRVSIGAQSGDPARILKLSRGHGLDSVYNACEILRRHKLTAVIDFIFGFPDETEDEQMKTLAAIKDIHKKFGSRIQTHFFMPLPATPLYYSKYSPIAPAALALLEKYCSGGICTDWYKEGIEQSSRIYKILEEVKS